MPLQVPLKSRRPRLIQFPPCAAPWASFAHPSLLICFALLATAACAECRRAFAHAHWFKLIDVSHCRRRSQMAIGLFSCSSKSLPQPRDRRRCFAVLPLMTLAGFSVFFISASSSSLSSRPPAPGLDSWPSHGVPVTRTLLLVVLLAAAAYWQAPQDTPRDRPWNGAAGPGRATGTGMPAVVHEAGLGSRWSFEPAGASFAAVSYVENPLRAGREGARQACLGLVSPQPPSTL